MSWRSAFALREQHLDASGISASLRIEDSLPPVTGDAHQLQQAFLNILLNAEQALRDRGHTLRASARMEHAERDWIVVDFFNDGPPIPTDVLKHIFNPFFTTKSKDEGTGLGLTICQRIVREHGGEIKVESTSEGTTFHLFLPPKREG